MAKPKYNSKKGDVRTPEEHRKILQEIDAVQSERSRKGVAKSAKRLKNTLGISSTMYKKERKPKNTKPKIYDLGRYARE
ncbi:hypothetical protein [Yersinia phage fHe-Yen9-04]|uniref:Uncharacterized protein n=2 Tax=Eneladusvirus Yen904 TaxID=2560849 RepID=A0A2C9CYD0_9CAUD|nr:hypothetical protein FDJ41_gp061 [Yersinia phage fHe-Yen9-04]SOK58338.1 hypothetical protein [Yersinia phage fHe-Yen9-04]SOK58875.1 hypothetical protein [Yersinia phage fHe-Yen9-03]VUE36107.1 hypothetical protein [Yersinia phage fHe-Yen9-04]